MKIEKIECFRVGMPLVYPFRTAYGDDDRIETVLVKLTADGGYGWGEATPWGHPGYSPESAATACLVLREYLGPLIIGKEVASGVALQDLLGPVKGNPFAKAALDLAWWDLEARRRGEPLWKCLGGRGGEVTVGADFGIMESIPDLLKTIEEAVRAGFARVKLKFRPGWDLDMVKAVREKFPDLRFHIDCNSAYTLDDLEMFKALDAFGLAMIEQPLAHDDLIDHAMLQTELKTPLCLDESIVSPDRARQAIRIGACRWINVKPGRVGGLTRALAIHDLCQEQGMPCWVGGMLESAVGARVCLALASLPNFKYPGDIFPSDRFYKNDLSQPELALSGPSKMRLPDTPGCGAEPVPELLEKQQIEHFSLSA